MNAEGQAIQFLLQKNIYQYYDVAYPCQINLLKYSENYTWLITGADGKKQVLRICRPGYHTDSELNGQLLWMQQLKLDTDIPIADVIPCKENKFLCHMEGYTCMMFSFLSGSTLYNIFGQELVHYMKVIGEICAKLHLHVQAWEKSTQLACFSWNFEDFFGLSARWGDWSALPALTPTNQGVLRQTVFLIEKKLRTYGKAPDRYGLIHSDLNIHNILVDNHTVQLIDFDDCGYGWFLLDMAMSMLEYDKEIPRLLTSWLTGYENIRLLSHEDKEMIPTFIILRKIVRLGWIATHRDNDTIKNIPKNYLRHTLYIAEIYCRTKGTALFMPETTAEEVPV